MKKYIIRRRLFLQESESETHGKESSLIILLLSNIHELILNINDQSFKNNTKALPTG